MVEPFLRHFEVFEGGHWARRKEEHPLLHASAKLVFRGLGAASHAREALLRPVDVLLEELCVACEQSYQSGSRAGDGQFGGAHPFAL
jgi:hypothetical protein